MRAYDGLVSEEIITRIGIDLDHLAALHLRAHTRFPTTLLLSFAFNPVVAAAVVVCGLSRKFNRDCSLFPENGGRARNEMRAKILYVIPLGIIVYEFCHL